MNSFGLFPCESKFLSDGLDSVQQDTKWDLSDKLCLLANTKEDQGWDGLSTSSTCV